MVDDPVLINDWHPVMRSDALDDGKLAACRLLGVDLVVWRAGGQVRAWQDLCIHRGTRLSMGHVMGETLVCPYHGWMYDGSGRCVHIPAHPEQTPPTKARARTFSVREKYGLVWVCLGQPLQDIPWFPEESDPACRKQLTGPFPPLQASGPRAVENFLDISHLPFVHSGILGDPTVPEISDYQVERDEHGLVAHDVVVYQPDPYGTGEGGTVHYTYRVFRPLTAYLAKDSADGAHLALMLTLTPHDVATTSAWFYGAFNERLKVTAQEWDDFQRMIFLQDVPVVESQRPELLPLDLQAELHLRSDRLGLAYRRWLKELGLTFGTC